MTEFSPDAYWTRTVPNTDNLMPFSPIEPAHAAQKVALLEALRGLDFDSALEIGCGLGRITLMLSEMTDDLSAIDIGLDQVTITRQRVPQAAVERSRIQDYQPDHQWDLVVAAEVLMHIPPSDIQAVCDKLRHLARRWIVTVDWTEPLPANKRISAHNWRHDYRALFGVVERVIPMGLQSIFVIRS